MKWGVSGILFAGFILSYLLPAATISDGWFGSETIRMSELNHRLQDGGGGVFSDLTKIGIAIAIVAAFGFPLADRVAQGILVSFGSVLALTLPVLLLIGHEQGDKIGAGLWVLGIACVVSAAAPWVLPKFEQPRAHPTSTSSSSPQFTLPMRPALAAPVPVPQRQPLVATPSFRFPFVLGPSSGGAGATVRALARGFMPGQRVSIEWVSNSGPAAVVAEGIASPSGEIDVEFTPPPDQMPGVYTVRAKAPGGVRWSASFQVV